jgi:hypothetical protein
VDQYCSYEKYADRSLTLPGTPPLLSVAAKVAAAVEEAVGATVVKPSIGLAVGELVDRSSGSAAVGAAVDAKSPGAADGACSVHTVKHVCGECV